MSGYPPQGQYPPSPHGYPPQSPYQQPPPPGVFENHGGGYNNNGGGYNTANYNSMSSDPAYGAPQGNSNGDNNNNDGDGQERFAPQPGYVPQPHPAVTLYYGYDTQTQYAPSTAYPDSSMPLAGSSDEVVEKPKCQDACCAVTFIIAMAAFIGLCGWGYSLAIKPDVATEFNWQFQRDDLIFLAVAMGAAVVMSAGMLCFIQSNAECMIWTALLLNAVTWFVIGGLCCAMGAYWGAVFFFVGLLLLVYPWCVRHRIKFVGVMIKYSSAALGKYSGVFPLALATALAVVGINSFGAIAMTRFATWYQTGAGYTENQDSTGIILLIVIFFLLYWACEFARGWLHTIVAGVVGTFWYMPQQAFATGPSLKRASTTSMGSIAFGTLLVTICHVCQTIARMKWNHLLKNSNGKNNAALIILLIVIACLACLFSCFEKCLKWINHYAFTHVALYGTSYVQSGQRVVETFFQSGFMMIVQKDLTGFVIGIGILLSTAASAGVTFAVGWSLNLFDFDEYSKKTERMVFLVVVAVFLCAYISNTILTPLQSAVTSTFVTWSEDGAALEQNHAAAYHEMVEARNKVWM